MTVSTLLWSRPRQRMLLVTDCACLCGRRNFSSGRSALCAKRTQI